MSARAVLVLTGCMLAGCSGGSPRAGELPGAERGQADRSTEQGIEPKPGQGSSDAAEPSEHQALRVLVTGFNDWRDLGDPPVIWRCRDNPSCRLLLGDLGLDASGPPSRYTGPLVERLERGGPEIAWTFQTLPVTWGVFEQVPTEHDVIINIGLGIYDRFDALQLERGAYNLQRGEDALRVAREGAIDPRRGEILDPPQGSPIAARITSLVGTRIGGFEILGAAARPDNSYLCNQTHWYALAALHARGEGPREVYFLHIPYAEQDDYEALADAVAGVVLGLVER